MLTADLGPSDGCLAVVGLNFDRLIESFDINLPASSRDGPALELLAGSRLSDFDLGSSVFVEPELAIEPVDPKE